ncbi:MAG TPA: cytochrome c [Thermoleophilaceae bacterium]
MNLKLIDRGLAWVTWLVAAVLAVMLLVGPEVIAEDKAKPPPAGTSPYGGGTGATPAPDGKALFASKCGGCHTLTAAGTNGQVGPKLDGLGLDAATVKAIMKTGRGVMPSFASLSPADRDAIASFVAASSR